MGTALAVQLTVIATSFGGTFGSVDGSGGAVRTMLSKATHPLGTALETKKTTRSNGRSSGLISPVDTATSRHPSGNAVPFVAST